MNITELWTKALSGLEKEISAVIYDVYIKTLEPVGLADGALIIMAPTVEARNFVFDRYRTLIRTVFNKEADSEITEVRVIEPSERVQAAKEPEEEAAPPPPSPIPEPRPMHLNPKYIFDRFVVGNSNRLVYAAAQAVAANPGTEYNPLFIYGGVGLGKTHLMHAVGNAVRASNPELKVIYSSAEKFANEMIASFGQGAKANQSFRDKYRSVDVLMIDDIQFFAGKDRTQEEFFNTFNDLYELNKQIIISCDRPIKELFDIEERLKSRFAWGMIADIQVPDEEMRVAIFQSKAQDAKQNIKPHILHLMAQNPFSNIRDMEGFLNKVVLLAKLNGTAVNEETVAAALKDFREETSEENITVEDIISASSKYFNISIADMTGKKKTKEAVEPRQYCIYLISELLAVPLVSIGNRFGGRDHTTIMHSRNKVAAALKTNPRAATIVSDIKSLIYRK